MSSNTITETPGRTATAGRKPRVCFVGLDNLPVLAPEYGRLGVGGEQVQQTLLARALVRRGFEVSMIVADLGQPDGATWSGVRTLRAYAPQAGLPVVRFVHPRWTGLWSALGRAGADVYYSSCADMRVGLLAMYAARREPRPRLVFRIAHDTDCEPDQLLVPYWRDRKLYEYGLKRTDVILAQSLRQQERMRANYGRDSLVATMLVDRPERVRDRDERDIPVLWVNNIRDFKRPDLALELARHEPSVTVHMIGGTQPGFEAMFEHIRDEAASLPNLDFHGPVPYHQVNAFYERARVFVNTSDSEGFPNSYLQAWVRGTPVVAFFDPDGIIRRQGLGLVASSLDDMRQAIRRLLEDPAEWEAASRRCVAYMAREYDEDRILAPYLRAFGVPGIREAS